MRKLRKTALAAAVFSACMNMNGCVYGPPPDSMEEYRAQSVSEASDEGSQADDYSSEDSYRKEIENE